MIRWKFIFTVSFLLIVSGCSNADTNEIEKLTNRIDEIDTRLENYDKLTNEIEELKSRIIDIEHDSFEFISEDKIESIENEMNDIVNKLDTIETELEFVEDMVSKHSLFNADTIEIGDYVAGMTLEHKEYHKNWRLLFKGEVEVTGKFKISEDDEYYGSNVIFFDVEDEDTTNILPRAVGDERHFWFVIRNYEEAYDMLIKYGIEGELTIVIDNYLIDLLRSDVVNEADIIEVVDH